MKTIETMAAQGDILIERVEAIPGETTKAKRINGGLEVAHSETGHSHFIHNKRVEMLQTKDPFVCYLSVDGDHADLVHHRDVNPHETIRLPRGSYRVRRQREFTPEGWLRAVQD